MVSDNCYLRFNEFSEGCKVSDVRNNQELHSLYRPPNIVRVIKSGGFTWTERVARMREGRNSF